MFLLIPGSLVIGFLCSSVLRPMVDAVPYLFAYVTLTMAIGCGLGQLRQVLRRPGIIGWTFVLTHIAAPLIAYGIGAALFGAHSPYVVGFVLFAIIPLGVSSVLWVGMSGGSVALMLALVVIDSAISPIVVPSGIKLMFGAVVDIDTGGMIRDLVLIIVAPTVIGVTLYELSKGRIQSKVQHIASPISKLCFVAVVALNAAAIEPYVEQLKDDMIRLVPVSILLVAICYALGYFGALPFRNRETLVTVSYASGMRNISLGIVLAMGYFDPLSAVPVVLSILIQQPMATLHHYVLQKLNKPDAGERSPIHVR
ncbi:putative Na+-dependent transporter [Paenibacillus cellulosilyticus]|uniref:Putative Na+-dependent transporter n=2 Tax=Paenibacillus cellulosilyticus TaxID=375489 RepID=A0A2V2Z0Q1_9BACL|nr:bile acid:sodium symporter [Paenibacillus cellulosilyticus]PWW07121.1 putative Na+-dependent transporter [Paenibacillus cellulosilyticus]QKS46478.1 bile acid:sodium symporter family protein [Paenibacillus cellulosilyticus]